MNIPSHSSLPVSFLFLPIALPLKLQKKKLILSSSYRRAVGGSKFSASFEYSNRKKMKFATTADGMSGLTGYRALHYVLKIGDRKSAIAFFKDVLGMKVLRHEEFDKGCEATCNGPYDGRWSKTMIGYGPEDSEFALELTYNYGISSYRHGNAMESIYILKKDISEVRNHAEFIDIDGCLILKNNGYKFRVFPSSSDRISRVNVFAGANESMASQHVKFYDSILGMKLVNCATPSETRVIYGGDVTAMSITTTEAGAIDHGTAFGRIAFACPTSHLPRIQEKVQTADFPGEIKPKILTPLVTLHTPMKASVSVVIISDLSGHEICFVGAEDFKELSKFDPTADAELTSKLEEDKSDEWFAKHGKAKEESK